MSLPSQYQGFWQTPDLWGHASEQAPYPILIPESEHIPALNSDTLSQWSEQLPKRLVLGKRAEHFLQHYLAQHPNIQLLQNSLQIITEEKQTLGELDFLYKNTATGQHYHLEQCFKFYVDVGGGGLERWVGPNRRDSLVEKLEKLEKRQFPLLQHPQSQALLREQGLEANWFAPQLSYKAALFTPLEAPFPIDSPLNPACWKGHWLHWPQFLRQAPTHAHYYLPDKRDWGNAPATAPQWYDRSHILSQIEAWLDRDRSPLCWVRFPDATYARWFVVGWP